MISVVERSTTAYLYNQEEWFPCKLKHLSELVSDFHTIIPWSVVKLALKPGYMVDVDAPELKVIFK